VSDAIASPPDVSVVIPARNEARHVGNALRSVSEALSGRFAYEVLVADHGSSDATVEMAERGGARVVPAVEGMDTIGALRNLAAAEARGAILLFLDADVTVAPDWGERLREIRDQLEPVGTLVTGSVCRVPEPASWIERTWFSKRLDRPTHLGSGHMVMSRAFFEELGGFDPGLSTGEDFELCQRARAAGGRIVLDPRLVAVHHGFPSTLSSFARREIWHGRGDATSIASVLGSKVALAASAFAALHAFVLLALVAGQPAVVALTLAVLGALVLAAAVSKFGRRFWEAPFSIALLTYTYLGARAVSLLFSLGSRSPRP